MPYDFQRHADDFDIAAAAITLRWLLLITPCQIFAASAYYADM